MPHYLSNTSNETLNRSFCFLIDDSKLRVDHTIASAYFSGIFCALGLISNLFALMVLVKSFKQTHSHSRSSFLIFLGSLAVTDFMGLLVTGVIVVSFHITHFKWMEIDPYCHLCNFMGMSMVFYGLCPLLLSATMAVERFVGIMCPFARSTSMSKNRVCTTVFSVWVTAGCISLLPLLGLGSYELQIPGSWCFLKISTVPLEMAFCLVFSLVGIISLATSFVLNTISLVRLLKLCCGQDSIQRRRDYEVEMMVQLIFINVIASICWYPLLIYILKTVLSADAVDPYFVLLCLRLATINQICDPWIYILFQESRLRRVYIVQTVFSESKEGFHKQLLVYIRFATWNQILDPWVYILCRRSVLKRVHPRMDWSRGSIASLSTNTISLTRASIAHPENINKPISEKRKRKVSLLSKPRVSSPF